MFLRFFNHFHSWPFDQMFYRFLFLADNDDAFFCFNPKIEYCLVSTCTTNQSTSSKPYWHFECGFFMHAGGFWTLSLCLFVCLCVMVNIDGLIDQSKESLLFIRLNRNKQKTKHRWIYSCSILVSLIQLIQKMKWMDQLPYNSGVVCCSCCTCIDRVRERERERDRCFWIFIFAFGREWKCYFGHNDDQIESTTDKSESRRLIRLMKDAYAHS